MNNNKVLPCACGSHDIIIWLEDYSLSPEESISDINKIECSECGNIVYGGDEESIEQWNNHEYDD